MSAIDFCDLHTGVCLKKVVLEREISFHKAQVQI